jgi:hypothetical protein
MGREVDCSVEAIGISGLVCIGSEGSELSGPDSLEESALADRFELHESSWPKKVHFLGVDLRVDGLPGAVGVVASLSIGLELCLRGLGTSGTENESGVKSNLADAVLGRAPIVLVAEEPFGLSLEGLEVETIDDKLPVVECPARMVVSDDSLDTKETGRGMTSICSAKRRCRGSWPVAGETGADSARCWTLSGFMIRETSEMEIAAERLCWWPFLLGAGLRVSVVLLGLVESSVAPPSLPINSLAPLLCPPGREGIVRVPGLGGGLARPVLDASPNENEGRSGGPDAT